MQMNKTLVIIAILVCLTFPFYFLRVRSQQLAQTQTPTPSITTCIPTFVDGGGPYYQPNTPMRSQLAPDVHLGEELTVSGKVLAADCVTPLANVIVDIWQANETGNYDDEWYRGRVITNDKGEYTFSTVVPKGYGQGTGYRPPHIHFKIWRDGTELITSQMFMPASKAQGIEDAYIMQVTTTEENGNRFHEGYHDIIVP